MENLSPRVPVSQVTEDPQTTLRKGARLPGYPALLLSKPIASGLPDTGEHKLKVQDGASPSVKIMTWSERKTFWFEPLSCWPSLPGSPTPFGLA